MSEIISFFLGVAFLSLILSFLLDVYEYRRTRKALECAMALQAYDMERRFEND